MKTELTRIEKTSRVVLALLVGILIWGSAIDKENFCIETRLPLVLEVADGYVVMGDYKDSVLVKLNGSGLDMLSHQISSSLSLISRNVQITGTQDFPASITLRLGASDVHPLGSVVVSQLEPDQISFFVDTVISRELPVSVLFSDEIPTRFRFVSVEPGCITVTGPSSVILLMDSVTTEKVNTGSGHITASLAFSGDMVAYSVGLVRVRISEPVVSAKCSDRQ
ncbi:MAG: hypothetical protein K8S62_15340 [Candidatus Sabulitectum sp.]|nr:hypothetical protein [Candidatus Sabulitectum sp.]